MKCFAWTASHQRLKTNALFQVHCPSAFSPNMCVMCLRGGETHARLLLHCNMAWRLWTDVLKMFGCYWFCLQMLNASSVCLLKGMGLGRQTNLFGKGLSLQLVEAFAGV